MFGPVEFCRFCLRSVFAGSHALLSTVHQHLQVGVLSGAVAGGATAALIHGADVSVDVDVARHVKWEEERRGRPLTPVEIEDIRGMLALRGMHKPPVYDDEPKEDRSALQRSGGRCRPFGREPRSRPVSTKRPRPAEDEVATHVGADSVAPCAAIDEEFDAYSAESTRQNPYDVWDYDDHFWDPDFLDAGFDVDFDDEDVFADPARLEVEHLDPGDMCAWPDEVAAQHVLDGEAEVRDLCWDAEALELDEM